MSRPDDSTLTAAQMVRIQQHARQSLHEAGGFGRFPTPVAEVLEAAKVIVAPEDVLSDGFLARMRRKAGSALKRALSKVLGLLDAAGRLVYVDRSVNIVKQTFIKLHEVAHAVLPWQRDLYGIVEDCEKTLSPDIAEEFDRQANVFASEVLFQLDTFTNEAADYEFGIRVPLDLSKRYGASVYATIRRYVSTNARACVVLVIDQPRTIEGHGFSASLRRVVTSPLFQEQFGTPEWPEAFTPDDPVGAMLPLGRRMSRPRSYVLVDRRGMRHECVAEAFNTLKHQIFVLIHPVSALAKSAVILS